ncbi:MAG TPA: hypothetical protein VER03_23365 [Bryobacteraceae bacterium]|nr:hypothetical protein [Bryobacteraceae bacterium]
MRTLLTFLLALPFTVLGQPAGTIAGFGYRNAPQAMEAAPGQVIIVSIHGAKARLDHPIYGSPQRQSDTAPFLLSTSVAGFSADLIHPQGRTPAGIYGVSQTPCPIRSVTCAPITNVTLIIPFELVAAGRGYATLEIKEGNTLLSELPILAVPDKVHILTSCDESQVRYSIFSDVYPSCTSAVIRPPSGALISPSNPVQPADKLVAFAYGLGDAERSVAFAPFIPGPPKQQFTLRYSIARGPVFWAAPADGISLTDATGNYQIHFTVPPLPANTPLPACGAQGVNGNVTVTVYGSHSSDSFELCVKP